MRTKPRAPYDHRIATRLCLAAVLLLPFLSSCDIVGTGKVKVKLHEDIDRKELYCKYEVTKAPANAPLKPGEIICILCGKDQNECDDYDQVEEADGTTYDVKALTKGLACVSCPKGTDTPAGYTRENQDQELIPMVDMITRTTGANGWFTTF